MHGLVANLTFGLFEHKENKKLLISACGRLIFVGSDFPGTNTIDIDFDNSRIRSSSSLSGCMSYLTPSVPYFF